MARAWQPPLYKSPNMLRRFLSGKRFIIGGLAIVSIPAALGGRMIMAGSPSPLTNETSASSDAHNESEVAPSVQPLNAETETSPTNGSHSVKVTVNGQDIPVPENGTVNQTIPGDNGSTSVHVDASSESDADNNSNSSLNVNVNANADTSGGGTERSQTNLRIRSNNR